MLKHKASEKRQAAALWVCCQTPIRNLLCLQAIFIINAAKMGCSLLLYSAKMLVEVQELQGSKQRTAQ